MCVCVCVYVCGAVGVPTRYIVYIHTDLWVHVEALGALSSGLPLLGWLLLLLARGGGTEADQIRQSVWCSTVIPSLHACGGHTTHTHTHT